MFKKYTFFTLLALMTTSMLISSDNTKNNSGSVLTAAADLYGEEEAYQRRQIELYRAERLQELYDQFKSAIDQILKQTPRYSTQVPGLIIPDGYEEATPGWTGPLFVPIGTNQRRKEEQRERDAYLSQRNNETQQMYRR